MMTIIKLYKLYKILDILTAPKKHFSAVKPVIYLFEILVYKT